MKTFLPIASSIFVFSFAFSGCDTPNEPENPGPRAPRFAHYEGHPGAKYHNEDDRYEEQEDPGDRGPYEGPGGNDRGPGRSDRSDNGGPGPDDQGPGRDYREDVRGRDREYRGGGRGRLPVGRTTGREGFVISPYPPHNRIDVRGIPSGAKVMDPSVHKVFINP